MKRFAKELEDAGKHIGAQQWNGVGQSNLGLQGPQWQGLYQPGLTACGQAQPVQSFQMSALNTGGSNG